MRIKLNMDLKQAILVLTEGNPGAISVCLEALRETEHLDPDNALGGLGTLLLFDTYRFYGSDLWRLYKDLCGESLVHTLAVIRALQLGLVDHGAVRLALDDPTILDVAKVLAQVQAALPNFAAPVVQSERTRVS